MFYVFLPVSSHQRYWQKFMKFISAPTFQLSHSKHLSFYGGRRPAGQRLCLSSREFWELICGWVGSESAGQGSGWTVFVVSRSDRQVSAVWSRSKVRGHVLQPRLQLVERPVLRGSVGLSTGPVLMHAVNTAGMEELSSCGFTHMIKDGGNVLRL